jgi:hypothetical protein
VRTFCTLFDSKYLSRGIAMYRSLARHAGEFELFVLACDERSRVVLERMALPRLRIVTFQEFEDPLLKLARSNRPWIEYLWTCTSSLVLFVLERIGRNECTYIDADVFFFASPEPLISEMNDKSVLLTEHRYTPKYDRTPTSGRFNVQFMTFRRTDDALRVLRWWREACLESCALDPKKGLCGDQGYLNDWPERFSGIHVLRHLGGGVAPWNVQQYRFAKTSDGVRGTEISTGQAFDLVFYHCHGLQISHRGLVMLTGHHYELSRDVVDCIYRPYLIALQCAKTEIMARDRSFDPHGPSADRRSWLRARLGLLKRRIVGAIRRGEPRRTNFNFLYDIERLAR